MPFFCFRINISKFPLERKFGEGNHGIRFNEPDRRASRFLLSQDSQPLQAPSKPRVPGPVGLPATQPGAGLLWALGFHGSQPRDEKPVSPRVVDPGAGCLGAVGPEGSNSKVVQVMEKPWICGPWKPTGWSEQKPSWQPGRLPGEPLPAFCWRVPKPA